MPSGWNKHGLNQAKQQQCHLYQATCHLLVSVECNTKSTMRTVLLDKRRPVRVALQDILCSEVTVQHNYYYCCYYYYLYIYIHTSIETDYIPILDQLHPVIYHLRHETCLYPIPLYCVTHRYQYPYYRGCIIIPNKPCMLIIFNNPWFISWIFFLVHVYPLYAMMTQLFIVVISILTVLYGHISISCIHNISLLLLSIFEASASLAGYSTNRWLHLELLQRCLFLLQNCITKRLLGWGGKAITTS